MMPRIWRANEPFRQGREHSTAAHLLHRAMARDWLSRQGNTGAAADIDRELEPFWLRSHCAANAQFAVFPPVTRVSIAFPALTADADNPDDSWPAYTPWRGCYVVVNRRGVTISDVCDLLASLYVHGIDRTR